MKKTLLSILAAVAAILAAWLGWRLAETQGRETGDLSAETAEHDAPKQKKTKPSGHAVHAETAGNETKDADRTVAVNTSPSAETPDNDNDGGEDEEEKSVEEFDALTDKWMDGEENKTVSMDDVKEFGEKFRKIPDARKEECIHRALNLIPDENIMLLVGVLMDKTQNSEIMHTIYNDVLNRPEEVKKPVLQEIFKDKKHPCWADTAWILDVTGELPGKDKSK